MGTSFIPSLFDSDVVNSSDAGALAEWQIIQAAIVQSEAVTAGAAASSVSGTTNVSGGNTGLKVVGDATATNPGLELDSHLNGNGIDWSVILQGGSGSSGGGHLALTDNTHNNTP